MVKKGGNQLNRSRHNAQRMRSYANNGSNDYRNRSQMRPQPMQQQRQINSSFNASTTANGIPRSVNRPYALDQSVKAFTATASDALPTLAPWYAAQKQTFPQPSSAAVATATARTFDPVTLMQAKINKYAEYLKTPAVAPMPAQQPMFMAPALTPFSVPPPTLVYSYPPPHALPVKN